MSHNPIQKATAAILASLNDRVREAWGVYPNTQVFSSAGIAQLSLIDQLEISGKVQKYDHFCEDNDPYGEHDFGSFNHRELRVFWKIDYYNLEMTAGSEDPSDPLRTMRLLTIMLAEEW